MKTLYRILTLGFILIQIDCGTSTSRSKTSSATLVHPCATDLILKEGKPLSHLELSNENLLLIPVDLDNATAFHEGLAFGILGKREGYFDTTGKFVIEPKFKYVEMSTFYDGLTFFSAVKNFKRVYGYMDKSGEIKIQPQYHYTGGFSDGLAYVILQEGGKHGFIDTSGNLVIEPKYYSVPYSFSEGYATVEIENNGKRQIGLLDKSGKFITNYQFQNMKGFSNGLAPVQIRSKWGYINNKGTIVIPPKFEHANEFSDGLASVALKNMGNFGYIDKTGKIIIQPKFTLAMAFKDGFAVVEMENKQGVIDKTGKIFIEPKYDYILGIQNGLMMIGFKNSIATSLVTLKGETVIPRKFSLSFDSEKMLSIYDVNTKKKGFINLSKCLN